MKYDLWTSIFLFVAGSSLFSSTTYFLVFLFFYMWNNIVFLPLIWIQRPKRVKIFLLSLSSILLLHSYLHVEQSEGLTCLAGTVLPLCEIYSIPNIQVLSFSSLTIVPSKESYTLQSFSVVFLFAYPFLNAVLLVLNFPVLCITGDVNVFLHTRVHIIHYRFIQIKIFYVISVWVLMRFQTNLHMMPSY